MTRVTPSPFIAIACGGTGGHLFPGLAVAEQLVRRGCEVALLISPKEVDQQAVKTVTGVDVVTLPAVALQNRNYFSFARSFLKALFAARKTLRRRQTDAVLAMGGFTSAPPVLVAKDLGAKTFLHESNTIPGRANRWLSRVVNQAFVGFPQAAGRLHVRNVTATGTPVRPQFQPRDAAACRAALGFDPARPLVLVTGGSQGASGVNHLVIQTLPLLAKLAPGLQWLHLTGPNDSEKVKQAYAAQNLKAVVHPFFAEMEIALGAATVAVSRAGASSLAELAAMRVPPVLVPFPAAADNHQFHNARAFEETGAARLLEQKNATPEKLARLVSELIENPAARERMQAALARWHAPQAAEQIAEQMLNAVARSADRRVRAGECGCGTRGPGCLPPDNVKRENYSAA
jgi:UDP-N-acetylglucosamine--N-acetylmuramyl-(pentapeptide) pyrophosphoryl-undecaprenol N-acetylglucosamine transferase